jgi:hypothetical protein
MADRNPQVAERSSRNTAAVIVQDVVVLAAGTANGQTANFIAAKTRVCPDHSHGLDHCQRVVNFRENILLLDIQACLDQLQPRRIINNPRIDTTGEVYGTRRYQMMVRANAKLGVYQPGKRTGLWAKHRINLG